MKRFPVCKALKDNSGSWNTGNFCAPIFIADEFFGTFLNDDEEMVFEKFNEKSVRSGTVTFLSYKREFFALTCKHVSNALQKKQEQWLRSQEEKFGFTPPDFRGYQFFTPKDNIQFHFNYEFTPVPRDQNGFEPDIAIARIRRNSFLRLERKPLLLMHKKPLSDVGIATGYPEEQREIRKCNGSASFIPKLVICVASMQTTAKGNLLLQDEIEEHKNIDVLSGMSGGPIIWTEKKRFGLAGIVREGLDIQPKDGGLQDKNGICIHGERITPDLFENWIKSIPPLKEFSDKTKVLHSPYNKK